MAKQSSNIALWIVVGVVAVLVIIGLFFYFSSRGGKEGAPQGQEQESGGEQQAAGGQQNIIEIKDFAFNPVQVTIFAGQNVTWINKDTVAHQILIKPGDIESHKLVQGSRFTYTFRTPGVYSYHCTYHPDMEGAIVVR